MVASPAKVFSPINSSFNWFHIILFQLHGKIKQVHGSPRIELIRVAEEEKASLIITGTRGMGQVRRTFLGSVSDHVMHHSHVPVLICRHKDDHHHVHGHHHGRSHGTEKMVMP